MSQPPVHNYHSRHEESHPPHLALPSSHPYSKRDGDTPMNLMHKDEEKNVDIILLFSMLKQQ